MGFVKGALLGTMLLAGAGYASAPVYHSIMKDCIPALYCDSTAWKEYKTNEKEYLGVAAAVGAAAGAVLSRRRKMA